MWEVGVDDKKIWCRLLVVNFAGILQLSLYKLLWVAEKDMNHSTK